MNDPDQQNAADLEILAEACCDMKTSPFEKIVEALSQSFAEIELEVTAPKHSDGVWSLDIDHGPTRLAAEWDGIQGFGLSSVRADSYGDPPDELFSDEGAFLDRVISVVKYQLHTSPRQRPHSGEEVRSYVHVLEHHLAEWNRACLSTPGSRRVADALSAAISSLPTAAELGAVMSLLNWAREHHDRDSTALAWLERVVASALER